MTIEQLQYGITLFNKIDEIEGGIYRLNNNDISINSGGTCVTRCFNSEEIAQVKEYIKGILTLKLDALKKELDSI